MKKRKRVSLLITIILPLISSFNVSNVSAVNNSLDNVYTRHKTVGTEIHDNIPGFTFYDSRQNEIIYGPLGSIQYDLDLYYTSFTSLSYLGMAKLSTIFIPGHVKYLNGYTNYWSTSKLRYGYQHMSVRTNTNNNEEMQIRHSPVDMAGYAPQTGSTKTATISSTCGGNLSIDSTVGAGVSLSDGISIKAESSYGYEINWENSVAVTTTEPVLNVNRGDINDNFDEIQWLFEYAVPSTSNYYLTTYLFYEINFASSHGTHLFDYYIDITFDCVFNFSYYGINGESSPDSHDLSFFVYYGED